MPTTPLPEDPTRQRILERARRRPKMRCPTLHAWLTHHPALCLPVLVAVFVAVDIWFRGNAISMLTPIFSTTTGQAICWGWPVALGFFGYRWWRRGLSITTSDAKHIARHCGNHPDLAAAATAWLRPDTVLRRQDLLCIDDATHALETHDLNSRLLRPPEERSRWTWPRLRDHLNKTIHEARRGLHLTHVSHHTDWKMNAPPAGAGACPADATPAERRQFSKALTAWHQTPVAQHPIKTPVLLLLSWRHSMQNIFTEDQAFKRTTLEYEMLWATMILMTLSAIALALYLNFQGHDVWVTVGSLVVSPLAVGATTKLLGLCLPATPSDLSSVTRSSAHHPGLQSLLWALPWLHHAPLLTPRHVRRWWKVQSVWERYDQRISWTKEHTALHTLLKSIPEVQQAEAARLHAALEDAVSTPPPSNPPRSRRM